jgi:site-specific recombinase XerD
VFVSERGAPLSAPGFSRIVERAGREAKLGAKVHAHMLRHACGFAPPLTLLSLSRKIRALFSMIPESIDHDSVTSDPCYLFAPRALLSVYLFAPVFAPRSLDTGR